MRNEVRKITASRQWVAAELLGLTTVLEVLPSQTNFLTLHVDSAPRLMAALRKRGIIIRDQSYQPGLSNCVRLTIGTDEELETFMKAMHAYDRKDSK
jgi:histidinol-phosphate aminotransferase